MKKIKPVGHLGIGIALFVVAGLLFTFLPYVLPYPEPISPPTYSVVAILGFIALFALKSWQLIWIYLPIPLVTLFGFLEEASYGAEGGIFQPLYWEEYHVQVYDLHNLIPVLLQIANITLEKNRWGFALFQQLRTMDLAIFIGLLIFIIVSGVRRLRNELSTLQPRIMKVTTIFISLISLVALTWLLSLPGDAKNTLLLGYSPLRIGLAVVVILAGILPLWYLFIGNPSSKNRRFNTVLTIINKQRNLLKAGGIILLIGGLAWQIWAPLNSVGNLAIIERLNPVFMWITTSAGILLVGMWSWNGSLGNQLERLATFLTTFPKRHPAYIYVVIAVFLVVFAQAMDQDRIALSQYIPIPNPWGEDWNSFIEETMELIGAYELALAVFFFTIGRPKETS